MSEFFGHFHVLLVHLPIGILLLACVFQWLEARGRFSSLHAATGIAFFLGMLAAVFSAITGYLLSQTGDYDGSLVKTHQWFGISVAAVSILMYYLHRTQVFYKIQSVVGLILVLLIIVTGHLGGSLTHGSDYLTKSWNGTTDSSSVPRKIIPDVQLAVVYADIIQPILETKCYSCHGKNKQKGQLRMDDTVRLMKGGKDGVVIIPGDVIKSEITRRTGLPKDEDDHMPPKEKPQLTEQEISLIHWWVISGASFNKKVKDFNQPEDIKPALVALEKAQVRHAIVPIIPSKPVAKGSDEAIKKLRDAGVVIDPLAQNTNYLVADFVMVPKFSDKEIQLLVPLKEQLVELKLSHTSISDAALATISQMKNLMRLQIDHTKITDKGLASLESLQNLQSLNLVNTVVTVDGILQLKNLKTLHSIYLYQTSVKKANWNDLRKAFPKTMIDSGNYTVPLFSTDTIEVKAPPPVKQ